ncbi:MAG TPA: alkaline phosphatase family protein, partial [Marmoricola sp.]|nr:alkaline phosphatase family protein [Marmoricola sp.]
WSEHPSADPEHGAHYVNRVLTALQSNPAIWNHTLVIVNFDENDGYFDHVLPPYPEASTPKEYSGSTPIGLGARVPCTLISPWTRGGWVNSEVFDHTSVIRFLETWTAYLGKPARSTTITPWRRAICGDLTSAIDFAHPVLGKPSLPNTAALIAIANAGGAIAPKVAAKDKWNYPALKPRPLSFQVNGSFTEDRHTGVVKAHLSLKGGPRGKAVSLQAFPDAHLPFANTPYTVGANAPRTHRWDTGRTRGKYAFSIYGPDGFVRSHAGKVIPAGRTGVAVPRVGIGLDIAAQKVRFTLSNDGDRATTYTLAAHDYVGGTKAVRVGAGKAVVVTWPTRNGYYDVVITRTGDRLWRHRYAGRVARR